MKKRMMLSIILALLLCFAGCSAEEQENTGSSEEITEVPGEEEQEDAGTRPFSDSGLETVVRPSATGQSDPAKEEELLNNRELIKERLDTLETLDWQSLDLYAGVETSLLNSNVLCNYGFLTYDEEGTIYFADRNIGGIFVSDWNGKNRRQITPDSGQNLQLVGVWLYYQCTDKTGIKRINLETGITEVVREQPCSAFLVLEDELYTNGSDGFCVAEIDGANKTVLHDQSLALNALQVAEDGTWLGNAFNGDDYTFYFEGHLLAYNAGRAGWHYIGKEYQYPLLAGDWLSVAEKGTGKRIVWNLEGDTKTELGIFDDNGVSDGNFLYTSRDGDGEFNIFYQFDGKENKELFRVESKLYVHNKYLTPDMLYWMSTNASGKWIYELWYYDLETGEIGQIY